MSPMEICVTYIDRTDYVFKGYRCIKEPFKCYYLLEHWPGLSFCACSLKEVKFKSKLLRFYLNTVLDIKAQNPEMICVEGTMKIIWFHLYVEVALTLSCQQNLYFNLCVWKVYTIEELMSDIEFSKLESVSIG